MLGKAKKVYDSIGEDKKKHFGLSAVLTAVAYGVFTAMGSAHPLLAAVAVAAGTGVCKELYDEMNVNGTGADFYDLVADFAGVGLAALILVLGGTLL